MNAERQPKRGLDALNLNAWLGWGCMAAVVGAVLGFVGDLYHIYWGFFTDFERSELISTPLYRAHGILIAVGYALLLFGLPWLLQATGSAVGRLPRVGAVTAFIGTTLVAGDYWAESAVVPGVVASQPALADTDASGVHLLLIIFAFALLAIGWLLVGIALFRGRGIPRWNAILLAVGAVVAFTPFSGSNLLLFVAVGLIAVHAWRHRHPDQPPTRASHAR